MSFDIEYLSHKGSVKHIWQDILVNNAGTAILKPVVYVPGMKLEGWQVADGWDTALSEKEWRKVLDMDLTSVFFLCSRSRAIHAQAKKGKIISISSNSAELAPPYFSSYYVSKAALSMFTRCLASEWGPYNVNVNAIGRGSILTELTTTGLNDPERKEAILKAIPIGHLGQPRDIGLLVAYLASDASDYVTGQTFYIDGGQLSRGNGY